MIQRGLHRDLSNRIPSSVTIRKVCLVISVVAAIAIGRQLNNPNNFPHPMYRYRLCTCIVSPAYDASTLDGFRHRLVSGVPERETSRDNVRSAACS
jgi:hypothetical protein